MEGKYIPVYQYQCDNCESVFDVQQSVTDRPKKKCPDCTRRMLRRVFHAPYVIVRGSTTGTLGSLAETNATKNREKIADSEGRKSEEIERGDRPLPPGMSRVKKGKPVVPWWRKDEKIDTGLAKLSPTKAAEFIKTGQK